MTTNELKSHTNQVEALLEDADNCAANDNLRQALYHTTAAVTVLVGLVAALGKELRAQQDDLSRTANIASCLANGIQPD